LSRWQIIHNLSLMSSQPPGRSASAAGLQRSRPGSPHPATGVPEGDPQDERVLSAMDAFNAFVAGGAHGLRDEARDHHDRRSDVMQPLLLQTAPHFQLQSADLVQDVHHLSNTVQELLPEVAGYQGTAGNRTTPWQTRLGCSTSWVVLCSAHGWGVSGDMPITGAAARCTAVSHSMQFSYLEPRSPVLERMVISIWYVAPPCIDPYHEKTVHGLMRLDRQVNRQAKTQDDGAEPC